MIPTMIVLGLVLGRWWRFALVAAAVVWPVVVAMPENALAGVRSPTLVLLGAAVFGAANAGVGILVHQAVLAMVRRLRGQR